MIFFLFVVNISDCVEYLTWTYFFRRLVMNPSYYELLDSSTEGVEKHLLMMIEGVLKDLVSANCITVIDDFEVFSTPLGAITSQYYLCYKTVGLFKTRLNDWRISLMRPDFKSSNRIRNIDDESIKQDENIIVMKNNNNSNNNKNTRNNNNNKNINNNNRNNELTGSEILTHHLLLSGISLELLLQLMCDAFEFAELPVRHNEEYLNADLADELPWNTGNMIKNNFNNIDIFI